MYQLRDYQQQLINQIFSAWAEGNRRVMAQLSTGGGKTVIFAHIARNFLEQGEGWAYKALQEARAVQLTLAV